MFKILKCQLYIAQNPDLCCLCNFHWSQTRSNNSVDYRKNTNLPQQSMNQEFKFKTAQNSIILKLNFHTSFESQTRNYITCFGHICNHFHGQENHL